MISYFKPLSLLAALSLTSCFDVKLETTLNNDGSGEMVREMRSPDQVSMGLLGNSEATTPEELAEEELKERSKAEEKAKEAGVELVSCDLKIEGADKIETTKISFSNLDQLNRFYDDGDSGRMLVTLQDNGNSKEFRQTYTVTKKLDSQAKVMFGAALAESKVALTWNFSGDITSASEGADISADKRSVTWTTSLLDFTENGVDVAATFEKDSAPNYIGLVIVGLITLVGGASLLRSMKK